MSTTEAAPAPDPTDTAAAAGDNPQTADMSPQDQLAELVAQATAKYAVKQYSDAAELYSQATELQAEINGEMALENADLLYSYGKCLYFLAQQTSSVLGGTAASAQLSNKKEKKAPKKTKKATTNGAAPDAAATASSAAQESVPNVGDVVPEEDVKQDPDQKSDKPYFNITGDDAQWDDSDEDDDDDGAGEDPDADEEEDDDDFTNAYELLDLARVLYLKKLDQAEESTLQDSNKGKYVASIELAPEVHELKRRIADIYDYQAEVNLEGEKYAAAVSDLQACLALKEEVEKPESSILAECHYKLSLALEFAAQTQQRDADGNPVGELEIDWNIRNEAVEQQEKAIDSCKLRVAKEEKELDTMEPGPQKDKAMAQIEDVQDMISEMEVRLNELRKPPVSVKAESEQQMKEQISGVLGSIMGSSATEAEKKEKLEKVSETATDLSGLVKRKKPKQQANGGDSGLGSAASTPAASGAGASGTTTTTSSNGKRKVGFVDEVEELDSGKKARVEDAEDTGV